MKNSLLFSRLTFLVITLLVSFVAFAQEIDIKGKVVDANDQSPIPGVSIQVKGTNRGAATDVNGEFTIKASAGEVIIFSFIGYQKQEVTVGSTSNLNVQLTVDVTELDEIVVIGYGTIEKKDATGSVATVSAENFNKGVITSPQELLMGRAAGVQITTDGGAPGSGATIRIRGGSSLNASNDPLIIIDGIPVDNNGIAGMGNALTSINPNDIASMTVLKDASATAIYGSRASNGVIIITTKRGELGKPTLTYNGNVSYSQVVNTLDVLNASEFRALVEQRVAEDASLAPALNLLGAPGTDTDWQSLILQNSVNTDHNLGLSGSFAEVPYRASIGYTKQNGILKTSSMDRISAALSLDPKFLNDDLTVRLNFKFSNSAHQFANQGALGNAIAFDPTQSPYTDGTNWGGYFYWPQLTSPDNPITISPANPLALLELEENTSTVNRYITNMELNYKLPVEGLSATINLGTDRSMSDGGSTTSIDAAHTYDSQNGPGRYSFYDQQKLNDVLEIYGTYDTEINSLNTKVNVIGGYSWQHFKREGGSSAYNLTNDFEYSDLVYATENYLVSFYGRANVNIADKLLLTGTIRRDGSSRFIDDNKWGVFPAFAGALKLDEFEFMNGQNLFSEFKIRGGWGVTGQQDIFQDYPGLARVNYSQPNARYQIGDQFYEMIRYEAYDANIKWEETTTTNIGVDIGFLDDRFTLTVEHYRRNTSDLLNQVPIPAGTNFTNFLLTNVGSLSNKGEEVSLNAYLINTNNLKWEFNYNVTFNRNEITKLTLVDDPDYVGVFTGGISGGTGNTVQIHSVGHPASTFFVLEQIYDENGMPIEGLYVDQNKDGIISDEDRVRYNNPQPKAFMGFSSRIEYKDFDFSFNSRMNVGNYIYNNVQSNFAQYQNMYNATGFLGNLPRSVYDSNFETPRLVNKFYISNGTFFRMDNISLGYNLKNMTQKDISVRMTVQNAFVITKYEGLDPEVFSGIDSNVYPRPRNFILGVTARF